MFQTTDKQLIVYVVSLFVSIYVALKIAQNLVSKSETQLIIISLLFTFIICCLNSCFIEKTKDNFHFEVTPEKLCQGGPYMYSSNPEKLKYCQSLSPDDYYRYNCPCGYSGRPVVYEYTPLSDDKWQNNINCNPSKEELNAVNVL